MIAGNALKRFVRRDFSAGMFVLAGVVVAALVIVPLTAVLFGSLRSPARTGPTADTYTLENLRIAYTTDTFLPSLVNTFEIAAVSTIIGMLLGVTLAWIFSRTDTPWKRALEPLILVPMILSPFTGAVAWVSLAAPKSGFINTIYRLVVPDAGPILDVYTVYAIVGIMGLFYTPYAYLFTAGALRAMDPSLEESASILGSGVFRTATRITLPVLRPAILAAALVIFVMACSMFSIVALLGTPKNLNNLVVSIYTFINYTPPNYPQAAAAGTMILLICLAGTFLYQHTVRQSRHYVTVTGRGYRVGLVHLGKLRYVTLAIALVYVLVSVILPYAALILVSFMKYITPKITPQLFALDNYGSVLGHYRAASSVTNTLMLAAAGATIVVLLGLSISFFVQRTNISGRRAVDYLAMIPLGLPAMVLGIGFLWAYITLPIGIYGTIWILLIAFVSIAIPYGVRNTSASLVQIDRELEESATVLGATKLRTLASIVMPLLRPTLLTTWVLVFILIAREMAAAVVLFTPRSYVMSVAMWIFVMEGNMGSAAALGILQTVLILLVWYLARRIFRVQLASVSGT